VKNLRDAAGFLCVPAFDTPGRKDSSGAFQPEAKRFARALGLRSTLRLFDSNRAMPDRRREVSAALNGLRDLDVVAFFCHGWRDGIQAGWRVPQAADLAERLVGVCKPDAVIALYCCDTARDSDADAKDDLAAGPGGKGGFASALYVAMAAQGFVGTLWAHPTTAHTTRNPHVRVWRPDEEPELGDWACTPYSEHWDAWRKALQLTEFRYRMIQYQTSEELEAAIAKLPA
jgi:hypothetical protein